MARVPGAVVPPRFALALVLAAALIGCGSDDDAATTAPKSTPTTATDAAEKQAQPKGTADRGARRCSKAAFLAALLADVEPQAFKVDDVKCDGDFARARFANASCAGGQGVACDVPQISAWRLGEKRWRLIAYAGDLSCSEVRKKAKEFPAALCG